MKLLLAIALPVFAVDQATKRWILAKSGGLVGWQENVIPNFFDICYFENTGVAFSFFKDNNTTFIIVSLVAFVGIVVATLRGAFPEKLSRIGVGLLAGGIMGNVTDRLLYQHVVDFLLFDLHIPFADPFAVFNIADSAICIAVGFFILASFLAPKTTAATA